MNADDILTLHEALYIGFYIVLIFAVPGLVVWASYSSYKVLESFDVSQLWLHQERVDKFAVIVLGTWWIHSASMIMWTLIRQVQTQDYLTYMIWGTLIIGKMVVAKPEAEK